MYKKILRKNRKKETKSKEKKKKRMKREKEGKRMFIIYQISIRSLLTISASTES